MKKDLVPVIAQDVRTNNVLMLAYADARALAKTKKTGLMHYWSRSRGKLWKKGETSGHTQKVRSLHFDCDRDTVLARVEQTGPACHRNTYSCFADAAFPAEEILARVESTIRDRKRKPRKGSYTNRLLSDPALLRDKLIEEACELAMAMKSAKRKDVVAEAADVLYHLMVMLATGGVALDEVRAELERRERR